MRAWPGAPGTGAAGAADYLGNFAVITTSVSRLENSVTNFSLRQSLLPMSWRMAWVTSCQNVSASSSRVNLR